MNPEPLPENALSANLVSADALAQELVAAVRSYFFSYDVEDMTRAILIWNDLRPWLVDPSKGFSFRLVVRGWRAAITLKRQISSRASVSYLRVRRASVSTNERGFELTGLASDVSSLDYVFGTGNQAHSVEWSANGHHPIPGVLLGDLDRLQRVLEWTCDFEAAHALYPGIPRSGFDSARAAIFLLASQWQSSLLRSEGWTLHDVIHPAFIALEQNGRTFTQATFSVGPGPHARVDGSRDVTAPKRGYFTVANAELFGGGTVMSEDRLVDFDPCQRSVFDFVAGRWDHVVGSSATLERAAVRFPEREGMRHAEGILLSGRADMNWYHWMIEHLPRLIQLDDIIDPTTPVVISDRLAPPALDAVKAITDREIIVAPEAELTRFGSLILPSNTVFHTDTPELGWDKGTSIDFDAVAELATRILATRGSVDPSSPRRIFWYRESMYRNLTNQDELIDVAKQWGFTVIHPETCSLSDQVRIFSNAEIVISAMGAVTPNYLFMQPGAHVVSLTSRASADYIFPGVIGHHVTGSFRTLVGEFQMTGDERSRLDYFHQPFHIAPALLEQVLSEILGRQ